MKRNVHFAAAVLVAAAAGACSDSTGIDELDDDMMADVAMLAADETIEEYHLWTSPLGFGSAPSLMPGRPGGHQGFDGAFSGVSSVTFYDADGVEQAAYDALTTASIEIEHEIEGSITRGDFTATIYRQREMTVSGLEGEETTRIWNGAGESEMTRSGTLYDGTERSHSVTGHFTHEDVVVPIPGSDSPYPLSGTITRVMTVSWTNTVGTGERTIEVVITFDGTDTAIATVNGETIEIDLAARERDRPFRWGHR